MKNASSMAQGPLLDRTGERGLDAGEVRSLAERLVDAARRGREAGDGVLLDLEVEDVRCVLVRRHPEPAHPEAVLSPSLSPREREIARMVARGYPNKTIAGVLEISSWTVSTHLRRIFAKLGVSSRAAMVALLAEEGQLGGPPGRPRL